MERGLDLFPNSRRCEPRRGRGRGRGLDGRTDTETDTERSTAEAAQAQRCNGDVRVCGSEE
eukprot:scaffold96_cov167-Ochromonas_danica.AAC.58